MTKETLQQRYEFYLGAYRESDAMQRERVLQGIVTKDIISTLPSGESHGLGALLQHIEQFQRERPGAHFESGKLSFHHDQFLVEITLQDAAGMTLASAHTYGRLDEGGLITHLVGFF